MLTRTSNSYIMAGMLQRLLCFLLRCRHQKTTWPHTDRRGVYIACLDCGTRLTYNWREMRIERDNAGESSNIIEATDLL